MSRRFPPEQMQANPAFRIACRKIFRYNPIGKGSDDMPAHTYEQMAAWFRRRPRLCKLLLFMNTLIPAVFYTSFPVLLLLQLAGDGHWLRSILTAGIPFIALSVFRKLWNRPRPYEALGITPLIPKEKKGQSFPSRHVFSAFIIAMCWLYYIPAVGVVLLVLAALLAVIRVVGGVHYISDVVAGFVFAVACGLIGFWI